MKPAVQVKCPSCVKPLRVPPDAVDVSLKCKHCGYILQITKKPAKAKAQPTATTIAQSPVAPLMKAPIVEELKPLVEELPEFEPPAPKTAPPPPQRSAPLSVPFNDSAPAASDYNPAFERAGHRHSGRGRYKGPRGSGAMIKIIAVGLVVLLGGGVVTAVLVKPEWFKGKPQDAGEKNDKQEQAKNDGAGRPGTHPVEQPGTRPPVLAPMGTFPRRILAICPSNYLYLNPIQYSGSNRVEKDSDRRDFYKVIDRLASSWKVPKDQVYYVTDGPVENNKVDIKHPPLKMVITGAIEQFLLSSRPQDRIFIIFAGHAMEKDGEAYLAPLEGEFDEIGSLIPLKDIYAQLAKCPAQEKAILFDVCRFDPGRGFELPAMKEGMTEALEKALHNSPDGISVWTSCSAGQFSYEYEYSQVDMRGLRQFEMYGSIFMNMMTAAEFRSGAKKDKAPTSLSNPADSLPLAALSEFVNEYTTTVVQDLEKKEQKPKLTLKTKEKWLAYDSKEPLPKRFDLPTPPPTAKRDLVVAMFQELKLPALKALGKDVAEKPSLADSFPFTEEVLKPYFDDGPSFEDVQKAPEKYVKDYPLRVATVNALVEMRKLKQESARDELPEEFKNPIDDATKKMITDKYQRVITTRQDILQDAKENLEELAKKRDTEKSKRWLATYDFALAQAKIRLAYIYEYNLALGKVKLEQLPELDKSKFQSGWRLASQEKMISPKEIRDMAEEGKEALSKIVADYPNTPWAVMAKTQRHLVVGLAWHASSFGADKE
jgi:hypothetical protein